MNMLKETAKINVPYSNQLPKDQSTGSSLRQDNVSYSLSQRENNHNFNKSGPNNSTITFNIDSDKLTSNNGISQK